MSKGIPYWRLSGFYLFYFAALGALMPWWTPYLENRGFGVEQIGQLFAILALTRIAAPLLVGWLVDRSGAGLLIIRGSAWLTVVAFVGTLWSSDFAWLALVSLVFGFGWAAALAPVEALTLKHLGHQPQRYGLLRLWGSLGFIVAVAALGVLFEHRSIDLLPWICLATFLGLALVASTLPSTRFDRAPTVRGGFGRLLLKPSVLGLIAIAVLMQASHQPYYVFFTIHLEGIGHSRELIGGLWALGVVAEIGVFLLQSRLFGAASIRNLLLVSLALTTLRWVLLALAAKSLPFLLLTQLLHAASFGLFHAVMVQYMHRIFSGPHHARGQALYTSMCFGLGGAMGSWAGGLSWGACGATPTFLGAAALPALALIIALFWVRSGESETP